MPTGYRIVASPSLRVVSPGAKVTYSLERIDQSVEPLEKLKMQWMCINDPESLSWHRPKVVLGPTSSEWKGAQWGFPGIHRVICRVSNDDTSTDYEFPQLVLELDRILVSGPSLPIDKEDPGSVLNTLSRYIDLLLAIEKIHPVQDEKKNNTYQDTVARYENYRDRLKDRLESTDGYRRYEVHAEHIEKESQQRTPLKMFLSKVGKTWVLVDWTNPASRSTTGEYRGRGADDREAVENAFRAWDSDNRYPDGGITYRFSADFLSGPIAGQFDTDGSSFWDSASSFFSWVALGAAVVAGVVTLVAPVPGSRLVSAAIWTSIFTSSASAVINIGQRHTEGFGGIKEDAFDVLSIVGNLFGAAGAGLRWARGATIIANHQGKIAKFVFIGQVVPDGAQGVMLAADSIADFEKIMDDESLTPQERAQRLVQLFGSVAIAGTLLYINVKGTKTDIENFSKKSLYSKDQPTPKELHQKLSDPAAEIDVTQKPNVEGHTKNDTHKTVIQTEQDNLPIKSSGQKLEVLQKERTRRLMDAMGHDQYNECREFVQKLRKSRPDLNHITDDELIALRGYTGEDYSMINRALRENNVETHKFMDVYIEEAEAALKKLPPYKGIVLRGEHMDADRFHRDFFGKQSINTKQFFSTSMDTSFPGNAQYVVNSKTGKEITFISKFPNEREILFPKGIEFEVISAKEVSPGNFNIYLKEM